jgi:tetratricopeptide (TPR) repeat protein
MTASSGPARAPASWRARLEPCTPDALARNLARERFTEAMIAFNKGEHEQALETFVELYRQTCTTLVLYNVATSLEHTGERDAAIEVFELFLEREPGSARAEETRRRIEALRGPR